MTWYPIQNNLVGGWAVSNVNKSMADLDFRKDGHYIFGDLMQRRDAFLLADMLNFEGVERP